MRQMDLRIFGPDIRRKEVGNSPECLIWVLSDFGLLPWRWLN